jgi:hypothetical protein
MFDKKVVDTYQSIVASEKLRERVLELEPQQSIPITKTFYIRYRRVLVYAAGLVLIVSIVFAATRNTEHITVSINGKEVGYEPVQVDQANPTKPSVRSMPFSIPSISVILELEADRDMEITVTYGTLSRYDEMHLNNQASETLQLTADEKILWTLNQPSMEELPRMTIKTKGKVQNYLLECDESSGNWTIKLEKEMK